MSSSETNLDEERTRQCGSASEGGCVPNDDAEQTADVKQLRAIVKRIAREENVNYIPLYERMREQIVASPGRALTGSVFLPMWRAAFKIFVLHKSLDEVRKQNGWRFHVEGCHFNSRGGKILADLVQEFVAA